MSSIARVPFAGAGRPDPDLPTSFRIVATTRGIVVALAGGGRGLSVLLTAAEADQLANHLAGAAQCVREAAEAN